MTKQELEGLMQDIIDEHFDNLAKGHGPNLSQLLAERLTGKFSLSEKLRVRDHSPYAMFDYVDGGTSARFSVGDVLLKPKDSDDSEDEVGVVLQVHGEDEGRADTWGNFHWSEVRPAMRREVENLRPSIVGDLISQQP